jgi:exopolysaccharide production protein ExoQ
MFSRGLIQKVILGIAALILSGAMWRFLSDGGGSDSAADGDARTQLFLAILYLAVAVVALSEFRSTVWTIRRTPAILGLLLLALASSCWAEMPDHVFRRAIALAGTCLVGIVLAARFTLLEQLKLLRWALRAAAVLSIAIVILGHGVLLSTGGESVRGVFNHKNRLGAAMALALLMEWYIPEQTRRLKVIKAVSLALFGALLLYSNSMTSVVTVAVTFLIMWAFSTVYCRYKLLVPVLFPMLLLGGLLLGAAGVSVASLTGSMGRSSDLTGRTELWSSITSIILERPVLGYGFSGFWEGASSEASVVENNIGWSPSYSHNGYLEITLSLGFVGLFLFLWILRIGFGRALLYAADPQSITDRWPLAFLVFFTIHNLAECSILWQNCLEWSLCVTTIMACDPWNRTARVSTDPDREPDSAAQPVIECA